MSIILTPVHIYLGAGKSLHLDRILAVVIRLGQSLSSEVPRDRDRRLARRRKVAEHCADPRTALGEALRLKVAFGPRVDAAEAGLVARRHKQLVVGDVGERRRLLRRLRQRRRRRWRRRRLGLLGLLSVLGGLRLLERARTENGSLPRGVRSADHASAGAVGTKAAVTHLHDADIAAVIGAASLELQIALPVLRLRLGLRLGFLLQLRRLAHLLRIRDSCLHRRRVSTE